MGRTLIVLVGLGVLPAWAQGVFVTPGESSPLFSDKPRAGSREVRLRPLSVIPAEKVRGAGQALATTPPSAANTAAGAPRAASATSATSDSSAPGAGDAPIIPGFPSNPFPGPVETRQP
ncbi:hypothetical protein [uncultured Propionivibrio sp.]|uniref:hypothetical protein n=1 Tax=uncultured Propionivibrio sp. TaxID=426737 RepID=UPI0029BFE332|nr:hypothetical protein [uncultured Propionivibrio sp.]